MLLCLALDSNGFLVGNCHLLLLAGGTEIKFRCGVKMRSRLKRRARHSKSDGGHGRRVPLDKINPAQISAFGTAMRTKLLDRENGFSKQYLRLLVNEIRVSGNEVRMTGSKAALMHAVLQKKMGTVMVPTFIQPWLPEHALLRTITLRVKLPKRLAAFVRIGVGCHVLQTGCARIYPEASNHQLSASSVSERF